MTKSLGEANNLNNAFKIPSKTYINLLKQTILNDPKSPTAYALYKYRRTLGQKNTEDIIEDNNLEFFALQFLLEKNYIFFLLFHREFYALAFFLKELPIFKAHLKRHDRMKLTQEKTIELLTTTLKSDQGQTIPHQLMEFLDKTLKEKDLKLELFVFRTEELRVAQYHHAQALRAQHTLLFERLIERIDLAIAAIELRLESETIKPVDEFLYESLKNLKQRETARYQALQEEMNNDYLLPDGSVDLEGMEASRDLAMAIAQELIENVQDIVEQCETDESEMVEQFVESFEQIVDEHKEALKKINDQYTDLISVLKERLGKACEESKKEQEALLNTLVNLLDKTHKQTTTQLSVDQNKLFDALLDTIKQQSQSLSFANTPALQQSVLAACADELHTFMDTLGSCPALTATLPKINEVHDFLRMKSLQKPIVPILALEHDLATLPSPDSKQTAAERQLHLKKEVQAIKPMENDEAMILKIQHAWDDSKRDATDPLDVEDDDVLELDEMVKNLNESMLADDANKLKVILEKINEMALMYTKNSNLIKLSKSLNTFIVTPHHVIPNPSVARVRDLLSGGRIFKESIDTSRSTLGSMH
ncbi:MAG: hypothetical protein ACOYKA_06925 [Legionellaceae bacterium]